MNCVKAYIIIVENYKNTLTINKMNYGKRN